MPLMLDIHIPHGIAHRLDCRRDVLIIAVCGVGCFALAVGVEARGVLCLGSGDVERVDTAARGAVEDEIARFPG